LRKNRLPSPKTGQGEEGAFADVGFLAQAAQTVSGTQICSPHQRLVLADTDIAIDLPEEIGSCLGCHAAFEMNG
jgi:hypothetical protein